MIDERLRGKLSLLEAAGLELCVLFSFVSIWLNNQGLPTAFSDYTFFSNTMNGDFVNFYYANWFIILFYPIFQLPFPIAALLWNILNLIGLWAAARIFGGKLGLALLTYQAICLMHYGQIGGIVAGGLALSWWGFTHKKFGWAGLGLLLATCKFQTGMILAIYLWVIAPLTWRQRMQVLIIPLAGSLLSLILYPGWILELLQRINHHPPNSLASISLWQWIGPWALLIWVPALFIPMLQQERIIALASANCIALPYFQQVDLVSLFVHPIGWLPLIGNLGYLIIPFGWKIMPFLAIIPIISYILVLTNPVKKLMASLFC